MSKRSVLIFGIVLGLVSGVLAEYFYLSKNIVIPKVVRIQELDSSYKYINPLLSYDIEDPKGFPEYQKFEEKLKDLVDQNKRDNKISQVSVYFRNLSDGKWIGINELVEFEPGSLFKVPIMIAYLKQAESNPGILNKKIKFNNAEDQAPPQAIPPKEHIEFGKEYTIGQLIEYMIKYSDNSAANILAKDIYLDQRNSYTEMLGDVGLPVDAKTVSAKTYSLFLRILRNATYLNREMSEQALGILAKTDFKDGLVAGLPENVEVAHKFGEYGYYDENNKLIEQLHDCGIVYYSPKPYLLCVMTKGTNLNDLEGAIKDISKLVYDEVRK